jgi:acetyl-CoA C-acetyltransferase
MTKISVIGSAVTQFGELWDLSLRDLMRKAALSALMDANLEVSDIDAIFVANMMASNTSGQAHLGSLITSELGVDVDATRIEGACASGGLAVMRGAESILSGRYKKVLVIGAEKMTDLPNEDVTTALMEAGDEEWEASQGATFAGLYALIAKAHMEKYKTTEKHLAMVAVKNHYHASLNPNAHFRSQISVEDVLKSAPIATPLKLLDCSPVSDGAAAIVLADSKYIKSAKQVFLVGSGVATDTLSLANRGSFTEFASVQKAAKIAYSEAGLKPGDIDFAEVHDCFTITEILAMEDLGFYAKGQAIKALERGETTLGGKLPINLSGGLKGCGHPVGATGVKQVVEVVKQLLRENGDRQIKDANVGLTHNVGGSGATAVIHIFRKD